MNDGFTSQFFNLRCGVRQGCPLSGSLFVLAVELLALAIKSNPTIQGIRIGENEIKTTQYADDTTVFVQDLVSVENLLKTLQKFTKCSGLEVNTSKTDALWLGSWSSREEQPFDFKWSKESVYALGIHFSNQKGILSKLDFQSKLQKLQDTYQPEKKETDTV